MAEKMKPTKDAVDDEAGRGERVGETAHSMNVEGLGNSPSSAHPNDVAEPRRGEAEWQTAHASLEARMADRMQTLHETNRRLRDEIEERNRADTVLRESQAFLNEVLGNMVDAVITMDERGDILSFNQAGAQIFGYSVDEVIGQNIHILMTEPDDANHGIYLANYLKSGQSKILGKGPREIVGRHKNGSEIPLELAIGSIDTAEGTIFVGSLRDISDRKMEAEALRASEARFRDFTESNLDWFWETDADDRYTLVSNAIQDSVDIAANWYIGKANSEIVDKFYQRSDWQTYFEAFEARRPFRDILLRRTGEDGGTQWIRSSGRPYFDAEGNFKGFRGTASDVSGQMQAEDARRESEMRFRDFAESASDWFWELDADLRFRHISGRFEELTGQSIAATIGRARREVFEAAGHAISDEEAARIETNLRDMEAHRAFRGFEVTWRRADGALGTFSASGSPIFDEKGDFKGYRGSGRDITGEKAAEECLMQSQKMEAVGQLTGGIAHDFNNMLAAIIGNLDLIEDGGGIKDESDREGIAIALRAALSGAELTHRLLAFSRQQALHAKKTQINEILPQFLQLAERTIGEDIAIEMKLAADLWPTMVDAGQLENALLNLAINARDAMPAGGHLTFETANRFLDEDDTARFGDLEPGDYVMIAVSDNGTGMPAEVLERAFEPFFTTKDVGQGSGLGLSMVYGFARQSGGQVSIHSEGWEGTTVKIYLPRAEETAIIESIAKKTEKERPTGNETILVIEDDEDLRGYLMKALRRLGYTALEAEDGPAALEIMASSDSIDLLLTDVILPRGMNGREVANAFRERYPAAGVLYSSGYAREILNSRGQLDDGVALLNKPFRPHALARQVRQILDGEK